MGNELNIRLLVKWSIKNVIIMQKTNPVGIKKTNTNLEGKKKIGSDETLTKALGL